jgi:hypothetical protein
LKLLAAPDLFLFVSLFALERAKQLKPSRHCSGKR